MEEKLLWEILVPYKMGKHNYHLIKGKEFFVGTNSSMEAIVPPKKGKNIPVTYHRVWDEKVRGITNGLTILRACKGHWVNSEGYLFKEIMVPVRIYCTEQEIVEIAEFTCTFYAQEAVFVSMVSQKVFIIDHKG